jgi:molybdenum-dependent DNA-binding transcriptional regulator ModE
MTNLTAIRHDGWTYDRQRKFLETLAETGSAVIAAEECKISPRSAYNLRNRRDGGAVGG